MQKHNSLNNLRSNLIKREFRGSNCMSQTDRKTDRQQDNYYTTTFWGFFNWATYLQVIHWLYCFWNNNQKKKQLQQKNSNKNPSYSTSSFPSNFRLVLYIKETSYKIQETFKHKSIPFQLYQGFDTPFPINCTKNPQKTMETHKTVQQVNSKSTLGPDEH